MSDDKMQAFMLLRSEAISEAAGPTGAAAGGSIKSFLLPPIGEQLINGPGGLPLHLHRVSGTTMSCAVNSVSIALTGNERLRNPLRALAAAGLLRLAVFPDEHFPADSDSRLMMEEMLADEADRCASGTKPMSVLAYHALAEPLRLNIAYSMKTRSDSQRMNWQIVQASDGEDLPTIYMWHNGRFHFELATPAATLEPLWAHMLEDEPRQTIISRTRDTLASLPDVVSSRIANLRDAVVKTLALDFVVHKPSSSIPTVAPGAAAPPALAGTKDHLRERRSAGTGGERVAWDTIVKINASLKIPIVDITASGLHHYLAHGKVRCSVPGCGSCIVGKRFNIVSHHDKHIADGYVPGAPGTQTSLSFVPAGGPKHPAADAADISTAIMGWAGMSGQQIGLVFRLAPLIAAAGMSAPKSSYIVRPDGPLARCADAVVAYNSTHSGGVPVVLVFDCAKTRFNRGGDIVNILVDSAMFPAPRLLDSINAKGEKKDYVYLAGQLERVLAANNIRKADVVAAVSDTTSVMPKAIRHAGLSYLPCVSHVGSLMIKSVTKGLKVQPLSKWHPFLAYSGARLSELESNPELRPRKLMVPSHRFAYFVSLLEELCPSADDLKVRGAPVVRAPLHDNHLAVCAPHYAELEQVGRVRSICCKALPTSTRKQCSTADGWAS